MSGDDINDDHSTLPVRKFAWISTFSTGNITRNGDSPEAAPVLSQEICLGSSISRGAVSTKDEMDTAKVFFCNYPVTINKESKVDKANMNFFTRGVRVLTP